MNDRPQVALVIGGSGDIGRAVASRLGQLGYRLAITGQTEARLDEAVAKLSASGVDVRGFLCNLADETAITSLFQALGDAYGSLDVLVNAAGVCEPRLLIKANQSHFDETLRVNLVGPALVARHGLMLMCRAHRGTIINIASLGGTTGRKGFGAYCASKGGLIALTDSLREEAMRFGVRVASVSPEKVDTRLHGDDPGRSNMIRPADVAEAVVFLLRLSPTAVVREVQIHNTEV